MAIVIDERKSDATDRPAWAAGTSATAYNGLLKLKWKPEGPTYTLLDIRTLGLQATGQGFLPQVVERACLPIVGLSRAPDVDDWVLRWVAANSKALKAGDGPTVPLPYEHPPAGQFQPVRIDDVAGPHEGRVSFSFRILGGRFYGRTYRVSMAFPGRGTSVLAMKAGLGWSHLKTTTFWPRAALGFELWAKIEMERQTPRLGELEVTPAQKSENGRLWRERNDARCPVKTGKVCIRCRESRDVCGLAMDADTVSPIQILTTSAPSWRTDRQKGRTTCTA